MAVYQGIDSGNTRIRKVTIKTGLGGFSGVTKGKPGSKVLVLPANMLTFRQFNFPFQDKKRISNILPGELMESLVLPLDNMIWNVTSIQKNRANVILTIRDELDKFIRSQENSIKIIDAEPCALARTANYNNINNALIIDMGATRTSFIGLENGKLGMLRVRLMGGNKIDQMISNERNITVEEAEQFKISEGIHHKSIKRFFDSLFVSSSVTNSDHYEKVILTGGGAQMPGIAEYVKEKLELPVEYFKLPGDLSPFYDAVAFGAAIYDTGKSDKVNFKDEQKKNGKKSVFWLLLLLIPLFIFSASLKMKENQLKKENRMLKTTMMKAVRKEFPGKTRIKAPVSFVRAMLKKNQGAGSETSRKLIPVLNDISLSRAGLNVSFYEMDITEKDIKIKGETDSFSNVEKFRTELEKKFDNAEILNQKTKGDEKVDFSIRISTVKKKKKKGSKTK